MKINLKKFKLTFIGPKLIYCPKLKPFWNKFLYSYNIIIFEKEL